MDRIIITLTNSVCDRLSLDYSATGGYALVTTVDAGRTPRITSGGGNQWAQGGVRGPGERAGQRVREGYRDRA